MISCTCKKPKIPIREKLGRKSWNASMARDRIGSGGYAVNKPVFFH